MTSVEALLLSIAVSLWAGVTLAVVAIRPWQRQGSGLNPYADTEVPPDVAALVDQLPVSQPQLVTRRRRSSLRKQVVEPRTSVVFPKDPWTDDHA